MTPVRCPNCGGQLVPLSAVEYRIVTTALTLGTAVPFARWVCTACDYQVPLRPPEKPA